MRSLGTWGTVPSYGIVFDLYVRAMALINVAKKIEKARSGLDMAASETIVAACTTNPKGSMKRSLAVNIGGAVGAAIAERGTDAAEPGLPGMADRFVAGQHALVLTGERLFQAKLSAMTGKPKEIVAEWPRQDVVQISVEETKLAYPMTIVFVDGSAVEVEGAKGTDPRSLAL